MDLDPLLDPHATSGVVVTAAGAWLASDLAAEGFAWAGRKLQRKAETQLHQIHVQADKYNRTGSLIQVSTTLNVRERTLAAWRKAHPQLTTTDDDYLCGCPLGYASGRANGYHYGDYEDGCIDLTAPDSRLPHLRKFADTIRRAILPWFSEASSPELMVTSPAGSLTSSKASVVEWLASRDRRDLIDPYVQHILARNPEGTEAFHAGVALAKAGAPGRCQLDSFTEFGWSVATLTLEAGSLDASRFAAR